VRLKASVKIFIIVYGGLVALAGYLIVHNYFRQLEQAEQSTLSKLEGIATTLSQQVNSDAVADVFRSFPLEGDTAGLKENGTYRMYCELFARAAKTNNLKTPIYTLTYVRESNRFVGGIASNGSSTYGWHYTSPSERLKDVYETGGVLPRFNDDHGTWLSAVAPIKLKDDSVIAVIEADYPFDSFIVEARNELFSNVAISLVVMLLVGAIMYPALRQILEEEERSKLALEQANEDIRQQREEMLSSLEYARTIQETMLPSHKEMCDFLEGCLIFNKPRDIVSGDFYWFHKLDDHRALLSVADCTGHGVPGALMAIMGHNYLNEIVIEKGVVSPSQILEELNEKIRASFDETGDSGTDGMDMGICLIDKKTRELTFSGARRPLTAICKQSVSQLKGTRRGIGEHYLSLNTPFENQVVPLEKDTFYYLCSDGLQDQFGEETNRKLMRKNVHQWFKELNEVDPENKERWLEEKLKNWKGALDQVDDICLIGFSA
jgi:serine phosphatase RsbU (regulator of sigma subunit)